MKKFKFIAELCQNHLGSFSNVKKMALECAKNGADIIKLQYILSEDLSFRPIFENGLNMFLYQAQQAFSLWHNLKPKIDQKLIYYLLY